MVVAGPEVTRPGISWRDQFKTLTSSLTALATASNGNIDSLERKSLGKMSK